MCDVIDKRFLRVTHETLYMKAYEFLLERIQHYMREYHPKHRALMDDTSRQLNRVVAMKHASFQRTGNRNMTFPAIVEYPFFTRSELSNGVQLADLLAYNVYRAFKLEDFGYPYFEKALPNFYRWRNSQRVEGVAGPFSAGRSGTGRMERIQTENPPGGGRVMSGWANHIEPIKGTRRSIYQALTRRCQMMKITLNGKTRSGVPAARNANAAPSGEAER